MKPGGFWEAMNAGRHSERRGKRGVGGNVASRLLGFSRVPTLLGPLAGDQILRVVPDTGLETAHPRGCSCQARATSGVPFTKRGGECPGSGPASPDGLARYAGTRRGAQKARGQRSRPQAGRRPATPLGRRRGGPAARPGAGQVRGRGAVLGDPAHCARPSPSAAPGAAPAPARAGGGAAASAATRAGRRRHGKPPTARAACPSAQEARGRRWGHGAW